MNHLTKNILKEMMKNFNPLPDDKILDLSKLKDNIFKCIYNEK